MKTKKIKVGSNNLKKYLFLFMKGHFNNGLLFGEVDDKVDEIVFEISELFLKGKLEVDIKDYPFLYDKNGEQIGQTIEEYKE